MGGSSDASDAVNEPSTTIAGAITRRHNEQAEVGARKEQGETPFQVR